MGPNIGTPPPQEYFFTLSKRNEKKGCCFAQGRAYKEKGVDWVI